MKKVSDEIRHAVAILKAGGLVAFPTETVYGLGGDAENPVAIRAIYELKGRPVNHPLIVHLAPKGDIRYWAEDIPEDAFKLIDAFWPGPLTLILKRASHIPAEVAGGQDTIGLRCPSHPVAQVLLKAFKRGKGGLVAPSANRFGHISPTTAEHVREEFDDDPGLGAILDGGQSEVGIESTILDLSRMATHGPVLLRPGRISAKNIATVIGKVPAIADTEAPRVSGAMEAHYAPNTPVALIPSEEILSTMEQLAQAGKQMAVMAYSEVMKGKLPNARLGLMANITLPRMPEGYAHNLYASLRTLDHIGVDIILIEEVSSDTAWYGINDRLHRAAYGSKGVLKKMLMPKD